MPHPHISQAYDILYTLGGTLSARRVRGILENYNGPDMEEIHPTQIKSIRYDGNRFGAWVHCSPGTDEFVWIYIAAGDEVNRQMIALAASKINSKNLQEVQ